MIATTTSAMGSSAPTANAKMLNPSSLLMMDLVHCGSGASSRQTLCKRHDFVSARIAARLFVA